MLKSKLSYDNYVNVTTQTVPDLVHMESREHDLTGQFSISYHDVVNKDYEVSALVLYEVIAEGSDWIEAGRGGYTSTAIEYLFNGGIGFQTSDGRSSEMGRQAFISRVNYGYKSKYLVAAIGRANV